LDHGRTVVEDELKLPDGEGMRHLILFMILASGIVDAQPGAPLKLEKTIPLPGVEGRIDHLSVDLQNHRLFVAALANNTVEVLDINGAKRLHTISGLHEPQGVRYVSGADRLLVANAKDGTCRIYDASSFRLLQTIEYGDDADNIRFDAPAKQVYVGYGSGALGVLDLSGKKLSDIKLDAHPESFQLEKKGTRIFVNLPDSRKIAVVDRKKQAVVRQWETGGALANFPMALDEANHRLFTVCRRPSVLVVLNTDSGAVVAKIPTVGDSDDVFYDPTRKRIYASGGEGAIAVLQQQDPDRYTEIARIPTVKGARTSLFVPELGRLFLAVRKQGSEDAAIRVYAVSE
jgi:DNA-binding beta-propeller fold protein YncE